MSNVDTLKRLHDTWNRRDVEDGLALLHPAVEIRTSGVFPGLGNLYSGRAEARRFYEDITGIWEKLDLEPHEYHDLGGDRLLTLYRFVGHGRGGITVARDAAQIVTLEDGLVRTMRTFGSWDEARAAAGLAE